MSEEDEVIRTTHRAMNKLAKWRLVFASWQLGTRSLADPECQAVRDHREVTLLLRAEMNALTQLLEAKGIFTPEEFRIALSEEAGMLEKDLESRFPGFKATEYGMEIDAAAAAPTARGWKP